MLCRSRLFCMTLVFLLAAAQTPALAGGGAPRPFVGTVTATWDDVFLALVNPPATFEGGGYVKPLGETKQSGELTLAPPDSEGFALGWGSVSITAANGDKVYFDYVGVLDTNTGVGEGFFYFTGGTGRYAKATGGGFFSAVIDLSEAEDQPMTVKLDGAIEY